jgi:hypothetical protein
MSREKRDEVGRPGKRVGGWVVGREEINNMCGP